jgi:hypothetical protein
MVIREAAGFVDTNTNIIRLRSEVHTEVNMIKHKYKTKFKFYQL